MGTEANFTQVIRPVVSFCIPHLAAQLKFSDILGYFMNLADVEVFVDIPEDIYFFRVQSLQQDINDIYCLWDLNYINLLILCKAQRFSMEDESLKFTRIVPVSFHNQIDEQQSFQQFKSFFQLDEAAFQSTKIQSEEYLTEIPDLHFPFLHLSLKLRPFTFPHHTTSKTLFLNALQCSTLHFYFS
jgi:hypothetical protein